MMLQPLQSSANKIQTNSATSGVETGSTGLKNNASDSLGYEDFLHLLVMQLRYQDPLEPLKNSDFIAQNAQFSTVEQLIAIKNSMEAQVKAADAANASYATNMIGKLVAADVSDYNEDGEYVENYITGIVKEVTFLRAEGEILVKLDNDSLIYLNQIVSVRDAEPE